MREIIITTQLINNVIVEDRKKINIPQINPVNSVNSINSINSFCDRLSEMPKNQLNSFVGLD